MGASSWHYFTAFDPDAGAALQRLRQSVFESGKFGDSLWDEGGPAAAFAATAGPVAGDPARAAAEAMKAQMPWAQRVLLRFAARKGMDFHANIKKAKSIDEALELADTEGTHSILDIAAVGDEPDFGVAAPLDEATIVELFGTSKPTRAQVEELWGDISEDLERWQAVYFAVYKDGRPSEYAFIGCSGD